MSKSKPATLFLFIIQPFLGFLFAIRDLRRTQNCVIFVLMAALWGWSMSFDYTPTDNYRIAASFCHQPVYSFQQILDARDAGKSVDMYLSIINLIVHKFSSNAKAFFGLLGLIYGCFCIASIRFILVHRVNKNSPYLQLFVFLMFATASLANMAMPRFWTAAWIMTFATLNLMNGKYAWTPLLLLLPYIHFSYMPVALLLAGAVFFSDFFMKHEKLLFFALVMIFLLSFLLSEGVIGYFIPDSWISGEKATSKYNAYVNTNQLHDRAVYSEASAYSVANGIFTSVSQLLMKITAFIVIIIIRKHRYLFINDRRIQRIYTFILLLGCLCFFMSILRNVGWRFIWLLWLPLYYLYYIVYDIYRLKIIQKYGFFLILINLYTISFMFYLSYRTLDLRLFFLPLYNVIINGIDFPPVNFV